MDIISLIFAFAAGVLLAGLSLSYFYNKTYVKTRDYNELDKEKSLVEERLSILRSSSKELNELYKEKEIQCGELSRQLVKRESEQKHLEEKITFQHKQYELLNVAFNEKFEKIAGKVLSKNSDDFSKLNQDRLNLILDPLKEKIIRFEKKVEDSHQKQSLENNLLKKEIKNLAELNQQITAEANSLTKALKGDNKVQGNWGELVLEKVLERSGLEKGKEYFVQGEGMSLKGDDGQLLKPDVVLLLPDEKHLIIDAKVSLKSYEKSINDEESNQEQWLKQHILSIKNHVKGLSEKYYQSIEKLNAPDFVLLFLPIESSFSMAMGVESDDLFHFAWERKVVIVSPTTLLATLKTIASIWKNEKQNKNALVIAEESGKLYDKFYSFIVDMEKIGKNLSNSQDAYQEAIKKLSTGKGNLLDKADKLKKLGINNKKSITRNFES